MLATVSIAKYGLTQPAGDYSLQAPTALGCCYSLVDPLADKECEN
jgi:hypothetical protein